MLLKCFQGSHWLIVINSPVFCTLHLSPLNLKSIHSCRQQRPPLRLDQEGNAVMYKAKWFFHHLKLIYYFNHKWEETSSVEWWLSWCPGELVVQLITGQKQTAIKIPELTHIGMMLCGFSQIVMSLHVCALPPKEGWANYSLGAICGLVSFVIRPAKNVMKCYY